MIRKLIVPSTQQLFLTRVKTLCTTILVVLFLLPHKLLDNSRPLQSAYLSINSAYLAIRLDGLAVVPPLGRVLPLVEMFIQLGLNQDA